MPTQGWVGWIQGNRLVAGGLAVCTGLFLAGVTGVANHSSSTRQSGNLVAGPAAGETTSTLALPGSAGQSGPSGAVATGGTSVARAAGGTSSAAASSSKVRAGTAGRAGVLPGTPPAPPCTPLPSKTTGVTNDSVTVGIIVSDSNVTYAQFHPSYEGLAAYVKLVNDAGGVCGRKIKIEYSNDNLNPATHDYASLITKVFAFVGSFGLLDELDYQMDAPFNPTTQDNGEFVPDIGNIALAYGRAQSPWFAGPTGSVGPSLVNPAPLKQLIDETKANGRPCGKAGIHYLREPTGASQAGAQLSGAALAAPWGAGLGVDNVKYLRHQHQRSPARLRPDGGQHEPRRGSLRVQLRRDAGSHPPRQGPQEPRGLAAESVRRPADLLLGGVREPGRLRPGPDQGQRGGAEDWTVGLNHAPLQRGPEQLVGRRVPEGHQSHPRCPGRQHLAASAFASGQMFVEALQACGGAPTRPCVMNHVKALKNFTAGNLVSGVTPFRTTKVDCSAGCNNFNGRGVYDWKWPTNCDVTTRILPGSNGVLDFRRISPPSGYRCADMQVAIGKPA